MANSHRRRNNIDRIRIGGDWLNEEENIKIGIVNAYKNLLSDPGGWRASSKSLVFSRLEDNEAASQEVSFTEEEVLFALSALNRDKASRLDGFFAAFWQFSWDIVKNDIMELFKDFHQQGKFVKSLNCTFLVLIPKKEGDEDLKDFRPISLVGNLYKLIAKVLANQLKKLMNSLVNSVQNAFVEGRQILDAPLIANEVIDLIMRRKERGVLCKLDIEKAYDQINWNFIVKVLQRMGFGERWIGWIKWFISTASFSILINGSPIGFFNSTRGLRQGDPLAPYLFVLGMEAFYLVIDKAMSARYLSGYKFRGRKGSKGKVTHLLFAYDTLVFCKDSEDQMVYLNWILAWFEALSGLRINLEKSCLLLVGRVENSENLAAELGCKIGSLPTVYLGLPIGAKHNSFQETFPF